MIVRLIPIRELDAYLADGWQLGRTQYRSPSQVAYCKVYVWRSA